MLPSVALLLPLGAAAGVALLLASHTLAPPFQLSVAGKCLGTDSLFGECDGASSRWYQLGGVVRSAGADGCLDARGVLAPCEWSQLGGWTVHDAALCTSDGKCLGKQGAGAVLVKKGWAATLAYVDPAPQPDVRELWTAATIGASLVGALAFLSLFARDACAGCGAQGAPPAVVSATRTGTAALAEPLPPLPPAPPAAAVEPAPERTGALVAMSPLKQAAQMVESLSAGAKAARKELPAPAKAAKSQQPKVDVSLRISDDATVQVQLAQRAPLSAGAALCRLFTLPFGKKKVA